MRQRAHYTNILKHGLTNQKEWNEQQDRKKMSKMSTLHNKTYKQKNAHIIKKIFFSGWQD